MQALYDNKKATKLKIAIFLIFILLCFSILSSCGKSTDYIIRNEPSIRGTVVEVGETFVTVDLDKTDGENLAMISTDKIESKDSYNDYKIGDEIRVYYDGIVLETYPSQINNVYLIVLSKEAKSSESEESAVVMPQSVFVGGKLYMSTGTEEKSAVEGKSGEINSSVSSEEMPKENNQSNFGTGYKYYFLDDGTLSVNIDGKLIVFAEKEI